MKFTSALLAFSLLGLVACEEGSQAADLHPEENEGGHFVDTAQVPFNLQVGYNIVGKPQSDVVELLNGEEITLNYTFFNQEENEVSVVGVGGNFANPTNGDILANITDAKLGPIAVPAGEVRVFSQRIGINLPASNYLLNPGLYIVKDNSLALIGAKTQLAIVSEPPISLFSPQLLFLEFLLVATLGVGAYFVYINYGVAYFNTAAKTGAPGKAPVSGERPKYTTTASGKKVVDESWLPEHHVKKVNKRKTK